MNESLPKKSAFGVYSTVAASMFGLPDVHAESEIEPRLPDDGPETMLNVSWHVSTSDPDRSIVTAESSLVEALFASAVGASFTPLTVTLTVAEAESVVPSVEVPVRCVGDRSGVGVRVP